MCHTLFAHCFCNLWSCAFLGESKDPGLLSKENTKTDKNYSWLTDDQNEAVPSVPEPAISDQANKISVNITAANAIVMNKDTNEVLYQKKAQPKLRRPALLR